MLALKKWDNDKLYSISQRKTEASSDTVSTAYWHKSSVQGAHLIWMTSQTGTLQKLYKSTFNVKHKCSHKSHPVPTQSFATFRSHRFLKNNREHMLLALRLTAKKTGDSGTHFCQLSSEHAAQLPGRKRRRNASRCRSFSNSAMLLH